MIRESMGRRPLSMGLSALIPMLSVLRKFVDQEVTGSEDSGLSAYSNAQPRTAMS